MLILVYAVVWYGMVWYGMVWYGMVWYGMYVCGVLTVLFTVRNVIEVLSCLLWNKLGYVYLTETFFVYGRMVQILLGQARLYPVHYNYPVLWVSGIPLYIKSNKKYY